MLRRKKKICFLRWCGYQILIYPSIFLFEAASFGKTNIDPTAYSGVLLGNCYGMGGVGKIILQAHTNMKNDVNSLDERTMGWTNALSMSDFIPP
ncbi:hypothetical protein Patl1_32879 [Pistacia atlantica]|uniref:Uncharacterized protein n=1 Tax=Pistacia atlantica TaxID=434234 RepID=A0ACC1AQB4_9ROSI|nr:hypothetical protein Patl1_32879 [Pistacia atlantica]